MPKKSDKSRDPSQIVALQVRIREDLRAQIEAAESELQSLTQRLGAVGAEGCIVIVDEALRGRFNMVTGANEDGFHLRGVDLDRELHHAVLDRDPGDHVEGDEALLGDRVLHALQGVEQARG